MRIHQVVSVLNNEPSTLTDSISDQYRTREKCWWIGGRRINGTLHWVDEESKPFNITYSDWLPGQPDHFQSIEDHMEICKRFSAGHSDIRMDEYGWNDNMGMFKQPNICEKKAIISR